MNKNILIVFIGAVLVSVLVATLVQISIGKSSTPTLQQEAKVEILVAAKVLKVGHELVAGDLRWQSWPKGSVFGGAVVRVKAQKATEALSGRLRRSVAAGEPLTKDVLANAKGNFVVAGLRQGMRAVAIKVTAESMVGGFIGPGDYVDVLLTYSKNIRTKDKDPRIQTMIDMNLNKLAIETILQNVKILAVDQLAQRGEASKAKVGRTVTLEVDRRSAEELSLAARLGDITLSLRGFGDDVIAENDWDTITDARMISIDDEVFAEFKRLKKDKKVNPSIVKIYSGAAVHAVSAR